MLGFLALCLAAIPPIPPECEAPPPRDVSGLKSFAQRSGALSVGLDSVATWCFDGAGAWTGGVKPKRDAGVPEHAEPTLDCAKSIASCETAQAALPDALRTLLSDALGDLERPYLGKKYVPRRSGLAERPSETADCRSRLRTELFTQAQARMDLARLASQAENEHASYRKWLLTESLRCAQAVARAKVDPTRKGLAYDTPVTPGHGDLAIPVNPSNTPPIGPKGAEPAVRAGNPGPPDSGAGGIASPAAPATPVVAAASTGAAPVPGSAGGKVVASAGTDLGVSGPTTERERALSASLLERWRYLAQQRAKLEQDRDYLQGFLPSRELRDCRCPRLHPNDVLHRLEANDAVAQLRIDDERNTRCELCLLDAFGPWKTRAQKQCVLMDRLSEFELGVLERSDDGNGLPPRCFEAARSKRGASDAGPVAAPPAGPALPAKTSSVVALPPPPTIAVVSSPIADSFVRQQDYAPVPLREDGRLYVRIFTSAACVAEVQPGPMQARTGDLLLIPYGAKHLSVKSPCGGLAEVYWGREQKPRVSEIFGRNQPLQLQFKPQ